MKSPATTRRHAPVSTRGSRRGDPVTQGSDSYVSLAETHSMLAGSLSFRIARLAEDDMISTEEAALLNGTSRVTVNAWIDKGRAIGLTQNKRGFRLPKWQFEPVMWDVIPKLSAALGTKEGWALLTFLETPHGALQGNTPRVSIERGKAQRVLEVATGESH